LRTERCPGEIKSNEEGQLRTYDNAIDLVLLPLRNDALFRDPFHAGSLGVDKRNIWPVERLEILVVEARALRFRKMSFRSRAREGLLFYLAILSVVRRQTLCGRWILDN
jgi:hypothetical protein